MVYPPELLDYLQAASADSFNGVVYRHMFAGFSPALINTRGARWNPPDVGAIYVSLERDGAIAEADFRISLEPFRPRAKRTLYALTIELANVLDLSDRDMLLGAGIEDQDLSKLDPSACQVVGGAVAFLGHDGLLVPSARHDGVNLVIFPAAQHPEADFEVVASEEIPYSD